MSGPWSSTASSTRPCRSAPSPWAKQKGFEADLQRFFSWCAATSSCPWRPTGDPTAALQALIAQSAQHPLSAEGGKTVGPGAIYDALLNGLYAETGWSKLGNALGQAAQGVGTGVATMAGQYVTSGGSNSEEANAAINCLDYPASHDLSTYPALAAADAAKAPVFGPLVAWGTAGCAVWPVPATRTPGPVVAAGSPPIMVIGTTGDPATPYPWAVSLSQQLQHGVLLTRDGNDHVAYFYSSCVRAAVQVYLVAGSLPAAGTVCTG